MRPVFPAILLLVLVSATCLAAGITVDQIVKLSSLKTSDDLILKLVEQQGLEKPLTAADVVYLKQQGVSEKVIQRLMEKQQQSAGATSLSPVTGPSLRTYDTTGKDGRRVHVVTNLDANGKRMGPPPEPPYQPSFEPEPPAPREIHVTLKDERAQRSERDEEEQQGEEYYPQGIPAYSPFFDPYMYPGYYPVYGCGPDCSGGGGHRWHGYPEEGRHHGWHVTVPPIHTRGSVTTSHTAVHGATSGSRPVGRTRSR